MGLAELIAGEDEDYYMQELLTRDLYNQVQIQEMPMASIPDGHEDPSEKRAKKAPKEKNTGTKWNFLIQLCHLSLQFEP